MKTKRRSRNKAGLVLFACAGLLALPLTSVRAAFGDCPAGFTFDPRSGVGCKQTDCATIPNAHYSYEGYCVCGSSGSVNENPADPNRECGRPSTDADCPGCLYACVHLDEECPVPPSSGAVQVGAAPDISEPAVPGAPEGGAPSPASESTMASVALSPADVAAGPAGLATLAADAVQPTCEQVCKRLFGGKKNTTLLESSGVYPACHCQADVKDEAGRLTSTIVLDGDTRTTNTYDPVTGGLLSRESVSVEAERAAIRERLGYKYTEEEIDRLLSPAVVAQWFADRMEGIETRTSWLHPYFWWQHAVALLDHGFGNDADFVDTYKYGRCGDSMLWLERELTGELAFSSDNGKRSEAMLSITGEKYWNTLNHTALIIRPAGIGNEEWGEAVKQLMERSGDEDGLSESAIRGIDARLLDATVLDPYYRKTSTVKEFLKGWSVIRIS